MKCYICGNEKFVSILNKEPINIWTGSSDNDTHREYRFECRLFQCLSCSHIQQNITEELEEILHRTYESVHAQVSTPIGMGEWGKKRGDYILNKLNLNNHKTALEIGCANGYLLEYLKTKGFTDLVGIDPSLETNYELNGITYMKKFACAGLALNKKFDLILSISAFEHIKNINSIMKFVSNHLEHDGELFFLVPNCQRQLEKGDPAVFLHEHVHCYTVSSLQTLLKKNGFKINELKDVQGAYFVYAQKGKGSNVPPKINLYTSYSSKIDSTLSYISEIANNSSVAFHGACNSLNNILGWSDINNDFGLFDNDEMKVGKKFFRKEVRFPSKEGVNKYEYIIVVPYEFFDEIEKQYLRLGYKGKIIRAVVDK